MVNKIIIEEINKLRTNQLIESVNQVVLNQAIQHCVYMKENNDFSHHGFNFRNSNIIDNTNYRVVGECLGRNYIDESELVNAWNNSLEHKNIMLDEAYSDVGIVTKYNYTVALFLKKDKISIKKQWRLIAGFIILAIILLIITLIFN